MESSALGGITNLIQEIKLRGNTFLSLLEGRKQKLHLVYLLYFCLLKLSAMERQEFLLGFQNSQ